MARVVVTWIGEDGRTVVDEQVDTARTAPRPSAVVRPGPRPVPPGPTSTAPGSADPGSAAPRTGEPGPAGSDGTGDHAVDEAMTRLDTLDGAPLREHVAVFDAVHTALQDRLADTEG